MPKKSDKEKKILKESKKERRRIKKRTKNLHKAFIKILLNSPVTNVKISKNRIALTFFGHRISDSITVKKQPHIGEWSRKENQRKIIIDKYFNKKDNMKEFGALSVHEAVERFLVKEFGLNTDNEAHIVARKKEREYLESVKGNWKSHELKVFWDWHKQGEH